MYGQELQKLILEQIEPKACNFFLPAEGYTRKTHAGYEKLSYTHSDLPVSIDEMKYFNRYIVDRNAAEKVAQVETGQNAAF